MTWYTLQSKLLHQQPPPSPPSKPSCLPSQKAKKSQQGIKANTTSAGQWICVYLEENDRVPKWWREFQCLLHSKDQCPGDSPIQRMAPTSHSLVASCHTAKEGWLVDHPTLSWDIGAEGLSSLKDFHGTHDYSEVRREEMITLAMALQRCAVQLGMPLRVLCGAVQDLCQCLASS